MTENAYIEPPLKTATVGGLQLAWREAGDGERAPLLLLHGIGSNARAWAGQIAGFAAERRVVAWNAPGYQHSESLPEDWPTPEAYARQALALLDHLSIRRGIVVGQSLGAIMATALARLAPERVSLLVLVSPASGYGSVPGEPLPETVAARLNDLLAMGPQKFSALRADRLLTANASTQARDIVRGAMAEVTVRGYTQAARLLATANLERDVAQVVVPRSVIWGSVDVITPANGCRRVAAAAGCEGVEIPGLGHALATEAPGIFNSTVRASIAAVE